MLLLTFMMVGKLRNSKNRSIGKTSLYAYLLNHSSFIYRKNFNCEFFVLLHFYTE